MFEEVDVKIYSEVIPPSVCEMGSIQDEVNWMKDREMIINDFVNTHRTIAAATFRVKCLEARMKFIDSQPKQVIVIIHKNRHSTTRLVSVKYAPKGFEGGPYYNGSNLTTVVGESEAFNGKDRAEAFDYAINKVKTHPGSYIIVTGDMSITDLPSRARPFSGYDYSRIDSDKKKGG